MSLGNILAGLAVLAFIPTMARADKLDHSLLAAASHVASAACLRRLTTDDNQEVRISGILIRRMAWGPPNFGEHPKTDTRFSVWVIKLDHPITVVTGPDIGMPTETVSVGEIQIERGSTIGDARSSKLSGKHVVVQGAVHSQTVYSDTTRAVILASAITTGRAVPCED